VIVELDGITYDLDAMTVTENGRTLQLHPDFEFPNLPGCPGYSESYCSGWHQEDEDDSGWEDEPDAADSTANDLDGLDADEEDEADADLIPSLSSLAAFLGVELEDGPGRG
jgi:hypothetical protein